MKKNIGNISYLQKVKDLKELREEGIDAQIVPWLEKENN